MQKTNSNNQNEDREQLMIQMGGKTLANEDLIR
jgi:hypothetical protein